MWECSADGEYGTPVEMPLSDPDWAGYDTYRWPDFKVCFRTDLDRQNVMIFGTPRDVKEHIRSVFRALGSSRGGVIACGEVGRDTPLENIRAMYEEFMAFRY